MNLISSVYVDHQDEIGYPVDYVVEKLLFSDMVYLFGSDARNTGILRGVMEASPQKSKIRCVEIGAKIHNCNDIATAQNACVEYIWEEPRHLRLFSGEVRPRRESRRVGRSGWPSSCRDTHGPKGGAIVTTRATCGVRRGSCKAIRPCEMGYRLDGR